MPATKRKGLTHGGTLDLNTIRLLALVAEHGTYTAAAKASGVPTSTISQRIAAFEASLGTGLVRRTSRSLSLTDAGLRLLPFARNIDEQARGAVQALRELDDGLAGALRVSSSFAISQFAIAPLIGDFLRLHPEVSITIEVTNRYVDLVGEGYDLGLRAHGGSLADSTLLHRVAARTSWSLAASSDWLGAHGAPNTPEDLASADVLFFTTTKEAPVWTFRQADAERKVELAPRMWSDDMATLRAAAIGGAGIVNLPEYILAPVINSGALVRVLPDWTNYESTISLLTPPTRQTSRLTRALSDYLVERMQATISN